MVANGKRDGRHGMVRARGLLLVLSALVLVAIAHLGLVGLRSKRAQHTVRFARGGATVAKPEPIHRGAHSPHEPAGCGALSTRQLRVAGAASPLGLNVAVLTFVNAVQVDFALNWLLLLRRTSLGGAALVGATDAEAEVGLTHSGACFSLRSSIGSTEARWGSPGFAQMGRTKAELTLTVLAANVSILFVDADVAVLGDPAPFLSQARRLGADILFHTDGFGTSATALNESTLESPSFGWGPELNTGFFFMSPVARQLAEAWAAALADDRAFSNWRNDQQALNELVRRGVRITKTMSSNLIDAYDGKLQLGLLPCHLFPSGHVFFIQRQNRALGVAPLAVHLTFQNCDQAGKRHRMREARIWQVDPPERFDPPGGLISYSPDLPPQLTPLFNASTLPRRNMVASDAIVAAHFELMNHQLLQLRTALTLALVLNRTLVLPRFLCGLETVTNFAHSGIRCRGSAGCAMALPYWCPADHVLRMHYVAGKPPSGQLPKLPLRLLEHSALRNRLSAAKPLRVLNVDVPEAPARKCAHCDDGAYLPVQPGSPTLATQLQAGETVVFKAAPMPEGDVLRALREGATRTHLIHFESLRPGGFSVQLQSGKRSEDFMETMKWLGGGWCCVGTRDRSPGHFWYDLLWDIPHVDRFGRRWDEKNPWKPTPGP